MPEPTTTTSQRSLADNGFASGATSISIHSERLVIGGLLRCGAMTTNVF